MKHLLDSVFTSVMLVGILAFVSGGYVMYWVGIEISFKSKKWRALFKTLPFVLIIFFTFCFMRWY